MGSSDSQTNDVGKGLKALLVGAVAGCGRAGGAGWWVQVVLVVLVLQEP